MPQFRKIKNRNNLAGMLAVVTGADSGIGLCFCRELARRGCALVMVSNRRDILQQTAAAITRELGVSTYPVMIDLTDADCAEKLLLQIDALGLDPDILINNAGIFSFAPVAETSPARVNMFVNLHVRAVTSLTRAFAIRFAEGCRGGGFILNMSSMSCWMPMPGIALYSATKSYIRVLSRAMHYEMRDSGVSITVAAPGGIATSLFGLPDNLKRLAVNIKVLQTPEKFARNAINKMLSHKKQYINGWLNRFSIFFVSILPTPVRMLIKHKMLDTGIRR